MADIPSAGLKEIAARPSTTLSAETGRRIGSPVKLVIWDLDDTFWHGTLTEGGACVPQENIELVITLSKRGIISSICSKNNFSDARAILENSGIWPYFVFPKIDFSAKGAAIASIIEQANLRPENVLFIDDNNLNLEEARHYSPGLMTADPVQILPLLLDLPQCRGKDDSGLIRLQQYKQLEKKVADFSATSLGNEEFLRSCDIRVKIDVDVDADFDRIVELINRSNQLNFTKIRIETPAARAKFREMLRTYGNYAASIRASDKYGDYGIVGFFMLNTREWSKKLYHFVFSCRAMNMGIEQYVYERLGEPECVIVPPVANGLKSFAKVDWIRELNETVEVASQVSVEKLVLLGGCDLLQFATYCSSSRAEYVNLTKNNVMIRYDDFGFILSSRDAISRSEILPSIPCWTREDAQNFDNDLADARIVIVSLWNAMKGNHMFPDPDIMVGIHPDDFGKVFSLGTYLDGSKNAALKKRCTFVQLSNDQKIECLESALERIAELSPNATYRALIGATLQHAGKRTESRTIYNQVGEKYCRETGLFDFIAIDELIPATEVLDDEHLRPKGYYLLAEDVKRRAKKRCVPALNRTSPALDLSHLRLHAKALNARARHSEKLTLHVRIKNRLRRSLVRMYRSVTAAMTAFT